MIDDSRNEIKTQEQAIRLVVDYCERAVAARQRCNVVVPDNTQATRSEQQKAYDNWNRYYGCAIGALTALHRARLIPDNAYKQLQQMVYNTLAPTVVGNASVPVLGRR